MNEELKDIELLTAFIEGKLDDDARRSTESRLSTDAAFKELYTELKLTLAALTLSERERLREHLHAFEAGLPPVSNPKPSNTLRFTIIGVIVAISAAIVVGIFLNLNQPNTQTPNNLFSKYYQEFPAAEMAPVAGPTGTDTSWPNRVYIAYKQNDHEATLRLLTDSLNVAVTENRALYRLVAANVYLKQNQFTNATQLLEGDLNPDTPYKEQTLWYAALARIGANDKASAIGLLQRISQNINLKEKADQLLKELAD